jgi:hypothetical protein
MEDGRPRPAGRERPASITETFNQRGTQRLVPYNCFLFNVGASAPLVRQRLVVAASC